MKIIGDTSDIFKNIWSLGAPESLMEIYFEWIFNRASDILRKKKQNFAGFSGANSRKNRPISRDFRGKKVKIRRKIGRFRGIFAGKKSKFVEKSADFARFSQEKSQNSEKAKKQSVKNNRFRWIFLTNFAKIDQLSEWANAKAINIMVSAQFFATFI